MKTRYLRCPHCTWKTPIPVRNSGKTTKSACASWDQMNDHISERHKAQFNEVQHILKGAIA